MINVTCLANGEPAIGIGQFDVQPMCLMASAGRCLATESQPSATDDALPPNSPLSASAREADGAPADLHRQSAT